MPVMRRAALAVVAWPVAAVAAAPAAAKAPGAVPDPTATTSVVTVKTGGDRTGGLDVTPLAGVRPGLYAAEDDAAPVGESWATCVPDGDGGCSFTVPDTGPGGATSGSRSYVKQLPGGAPAGWFTNPDPRTGKESGSGASSPSARAWKASPGSTCVPCQDSRRSTAATRRRPTTNRPPTSRRRATSFSASSTSGADAADRGRSPCPANGVSVVRG